MLNLLNKRILRDLKNNLLKYILLGAVIIFSMFIVVSIIGAADTIMIGTTKNANKLNLEDGEFSLFVPLSNSQKEDLKDKAEEIDEMFYLDYTVDGRTLRVFKNRKKIDKLKVIKGKVSKNVDEATIERRFSEVNKVNIGDSIEIGGNSFKVTGIVLTPDYDAPLKDLGDSAVSSKTFGTVFMSEKAYDKLLKEGKADKAETYLYSYKLADGAKDEDLKEELEKIKVTSDSIDDKFFKEYWEENVGDIDEFKDGMEELTEGTEELKDGLGEIADNNRALNMGAEKIFESYLSEAESALNTELTPENFDSKLRKLIKASNNDVEIMTLKDLRESLNQMKSYAEGVEKYTDGVSEAKDGAKKLNDGMSKFEREAKDALDELTGDVKISNLTLFLKRSDNLRILSAKADQIINKYGGIIAGIILIALVAFVISVFVVHNIENETTVIGAFYALGVKKNTLLLHYITLPTIVTFIAGSIGSLLAFTPIGIQYQMMDCYNYYSLPDIKPIILPYLVVYSFIVPPLTAVIVNVLVINKKLSTPALSLLRNEKKEKKASRINFKGGSFIKIFRIRQMIKEGRSAIAVVIGMFICLLLIELALNTFIMCKRLQVDTKKETTYNYMYTYKYPEKEVPKGGSAVYAKNLKKKTMGYNFDITVLGIEDGNKYFDVKTYEGLSNGVISSAMAVKYDLKVGDMVTLTDEENHGRLYSFNVKEIVDYSSRFYVFMNIDDARELFGEKEDYYNVVFSDKKLDVESGRLSQVITKAEISKSSDIFISMMRGMILTITIASIIIFMIVMYLMMKVMIDRSTYGIALAKIFGYNKKEIKKLYLDGNFYIIAVGALICLPLSKFCIDAMYPMMISNVTIGAKYSYSLPMYGVMYLIIIALYFIINAMLSSRLNKFTPAEVLKNRE
ncbi:MAG: ABC transporter permease [Lachnospiraceae bacterium]|nr:ABC transporter permease [Lachnospiraceae bacterium]